jgi:sugar transferase (PEP-CTERM system associated)
MKIFGMYVDRFVLVLGLADLAIFSVVFAGANLVATWHDALEPAMILSRAGFFAVLQLLPLIAAGVYRAEVWRSDGVMVRRMALSGALGILLALLADSTLRGSSEYAPTPGVVVVASGLALASMMLARAFGRRMRFMAGVLKTRAVMLGAGDRAAQVLQAAEQHRRARLLGVVPTGTEAVGALLGERVLAPTPSGLATLARQLGASEVVVALDDRRNGLPIRELLDCRLEGIEVIDDASFLERESGRISLANLHPSWLIFSDGFRAGLLASAVKRGLDVVLALGALVLLAPLLLLVTLAVRLDSRGPVFYRQRRVGLDGRVFEIIKFRSMVVDAERDGRARWASQGDPRITRVGRFIRRSRIDELPQVINVLRGEMSFVGPRPERPEFVAELAEAVPYYHFRHQARPGLTGWAQVNHHYSASLADSRVKLEYDLYYLKHRNLALDLLILLQTVRIVLAGEGAH